MADKRKLQSDIDRTLKRVQEGRSAFQEILDKFESSVNQTQKEKFEGDLKKEIKKLQRLRDQIKTWLTANEVKDKRPLLEARKEIEQDMERFKVIEKETKTKAYSKEGLLSTEAKKDPLQKEKEELDEWLKQCISSLNTQMEKYEFEIESITNNNKKKRLDKDTTLAIEEKRQRLENCSFHIEKLETVMRLLDNERLDCALLRSIKDPIEYVIQSCDDISSLDYRNMYDDLRLDEIGDSTGITAGTGPAGSVAEHEVNGVSIPSTTLISQRGANDDAGSSTSTLTSVSNQTDSSTNHPTSSTSSNASSCSRERTKSDDKLVPLSYVPASSTSTPLKSAGPTSGSTTLSSKHKSCNIANQTAPPALMSQVVASTPNKGNRLLTPHTGVCTAFGLTSVDANAIKSASHIADTHSTPTMLDVVIRTSKVDMTGRPPDRHLAMVLSHTIPDCQPAVSSPSDSSTEATLYSPNSVHSIVCTVTPSTALMTLSNTNPANSKPGFAAVVGSQPTATSSLLTSNSSVASINPSTASGGQTSLHRVSLSIATAPVSVSYSLNCPSQAASTNPTAVSEKHLSELLAGTQLNSAGMTDNQQLTTCIGLDTSLAPSLACKLHSVAAATGQPLPFPTGINLTAPQGSQLHMPMDKQLPALQNALHVQTPRMPSCTQMHPRDAAAPFRNRNLDKSKGPIPRELLLQLQALESSYRRLPHQCDTEKSRMIICKNIVNGPSYYPREPLPNTDTEEYYMKLDAQTLFFIFYYFEGTKAQYFAAKALKRMSWRFHTKYMMWFQRNEEPKQITDEYESGSYIYYDFKAMSQRKKEEFVFQYSFLEDKDF
ncbi:unnamed protein product [Dicrocoelium dendriticum]|nr:unnamed protein product [Dicrocoelium dendriticum]